MGKFNELTSRKDIAMVFITQTCAEQIRQAVDAYAGSGQVVPTILEIPSKDQPYDPRKDSVINACCFSFHRHWLTWELRLHDECQLQPSICSCDCSLPVDFFLAAACLVACFAMVAIAGTQFCAALLHLLQQILTRSANKENKN